MKIAKNRLYRSSEIITRDLMGQDILTLHIYDGRIDTSHRARNIPSSIGYGYIPYYFPDVYCDTAKVEDIIQSYEIKMVKTI